MACQKMTLRLILVLLFVLVAWQQLAQASKIAYKKPLYGKPAYTAKEKMRLKIKPTITSTSTTTTEPDWPAPVEFIINSSTPASTTTTTTSTMEQPQSSSTEATMESSTPEQEHEQEVKQAVEEEVELDTDNSSSTDAPISSTTAPSVDNTLQSPPMPAEVDAAQPVPCTCGVFLSSQIQNGLPANPLIHNEMDRVFPCNAIGRKQCQTKCLEAIVQHLPNSANIVCGTLGHDCHKERAYLFIKNCHNQWINTNLQAGREYCCKAGTPYRCPLMG